MSEGISEPYFRFGEVKISGWISVTLGGLSVLGVLCFHFPDFLTTPQLHEVKFLWPIHAVHHSVEHMDWLAGSRLHFLEPRVTRTLVLIPAFILGIAKEPLTLYIVFAGFQAGLIHANIRWDLGPLKYVLCSPRYHHWHHSSDDEAIDKNYVAHLPVIDWLFGPSTCRATRPSGRAATVRSAFRCRRGSPGSSFIHSIGTR